MNKYKTHNIDLMLDSEGITNECNGCEYLKEWIEWHPYEMGSAGEDMAECICHDDKLCKRIKETNNTH